jgi:hypothetical protein
LREAIFAQRSLAELRAIKVAPPVKNAVLDIAVRYPQVLEDLLEGGADPNHTNPFGKTPLMYAAQYNSLRAVELLLDAGADPNATTYWPQDDCNYTLNTSKMTPLHYAVRYASSSVVELLLRRGAMTFNATETRWRGNTGHPIDWLQRYASPGADEPNANIAAGDRGRLEALLRVPNEAERAVLSRELVLRGESEYAAGRIESAYRALQSALSAQRSNRRALDDLPLVALKSGRVGVALEAAANILAGDAQPEFKARGWFNMGLACEQAGRMFSYNERYYCRSGIVYPLLEAWRSQPSRGRKDKLRELFVTDAIGSCTGTAPAGSARKYHFTMHYDEQARVQSTRIYVYHSSAQSIDPEQVYWQNSLLVVGAPNRYQKVRQTPQLLQRYDFDDFAITVLESSQIAQSPITIDGRECPADSMW